jgi:hypothetical protein
VHANIVNRQLQRISIVPRVFGEETKLFGTLGSEQFVSNVVYACATAGRLEKSQAAGKVGGIVRRDDCYDCRSSILHLRDEDKC